MKGPTGCLHFCVVPVNGLQLVRLHKSKKKQTKNNTTAATTTKKTPISDIFEAGMFLCLALLRMGKSFSTVICKGSILDAKCHAL